MREPTAHALWHEAFVRASCVGTAQYPSPAVLAAAIKASGTEVVTVSLRREAGGGRAGESFWSLIRELGVQSPAQYRRLPQREGSGHHRADGARSFRDRSWIKLEVIGDDDLLQPDVFGLVEAAGILARDGFKVFPYTTEDLVVAEKLLGAGCEVLMPWGAPIGSGRGLNNVFGLASAAQTFPRGAADRRCRHRHAGACGGGDGARL